MKNVKIILAVGIALALAFTFNACDSGGGGGGGGGGNSSSNGDSGGFCDIKGYRIEQIGIQYWMAENWNCNVNGSVCYGNDPANCAKYGRMYNWEAAMNACPSGWHLPSNDDWDDLMRFVDNSNDASSPYNSMTAGKYLKATSGWNDYNGSSGNGTDAHGFSALPGGYGSSGDNFYDVGDIGYWWSSSEYDIDYANGRAMYYDGEDVGYNLLIKKDFLRSIRCVKD